MKSSLRTSSRQRPKTWATTAVFVLGGCRDYTCVDTADCAYSTDAGVSAEDAGGVSVSTNDPAAITSAGPSEPSVDRSTGDLNEHTSHGATTLTTGTLNTDGSAAGTPSNDEDTNPSSSVSATNTPPATNDSSSSSATIASDGTSSANAMSTEAASSSGSDTSGAETSSEASSGQTGGPTPSAGCGKPDPNTGSSSTPLSVSNHNYYVKLPQPYDPNLPYPVVVMFNPTGNPISWAESAAGFETEAITWIRVYPHMANQSNGWGPADVPFFAPFYERLTSDYCIDTARVFAAGESSGGDFAGILGCEHADKVRSVAPCATKHLDAYDSNVDTRQCTGQVTAIVIHGKNDNVVGTENGPKMRDFYRALNHCSDGSTPVAGYTDTLSNCVRYEGCDEGYDTYWCNHTDPEYSNTNHGWPKFAAKMLVETWSTL